MPHTAPARFSLRIIALTVLAAFGVATVAATEAQAGKNRPAVVKVMTRNVYLGADLGPAIQSSSLGEAIDAGGVIYNEVARTNFPERAVPLAAEIQAKKPQLVGLQEVAHWREQIPSDGGNPSTTGIGTDATDTTFDFLALLMAEINKGPAKYDVVAVQDEFSAELPADIDGNNETGNPALSGADLDASLTMRDVILLKRGTRVSVSKPRMDHYDTLYSAQVGGLVKVTAKRGWLSVEAEVSTGKNTKPNKFRFLNTHFEAFGDPSIREAQAKELLAKPLDTRKKVVLAGDLNSGLAEPHRIFGDDRLAFKALREAGLKDKGAVQSCCFPSALDNPAFRYDHTVDHILVKPNAQLIRSGITGNRASEMTPSGLWPSDHGGVFSKIKLKRKP